MSHAAGHESELAWPREGQDTAREEGSQMLPAAGELEAATPPQILPPNPL